tara:strand:+ start:608 stop:841 length:234 start_codon:yes stop_codon:yes gene_type:complete
MEEPVHYIVLLLLQLDGTLIKDVLEFTRQMTLMECLAFGDAHREAIATYSEKVNAWFLNDGSGTWQGHECVQDPDKL